MIIGQDNSCKWITRFEDGTEDIVSDPNADDDYEFDYDHIMLEKDCSNENFNTLVA